MAEKERTRTEKEKTRTKKRDKAVKIVADS